MVAQLKPTSNDMVDLLNTVQGAASLAVASQNTVYGKSFALKKNRAFGIIVRFTGTTLNTKVELEVGNDDLTAAEEGSAKTSWAVGATISSGVVSSAAVAAAVSPVVAQYGRLKLTGGAGNTSDVLMVQAQLALSKNL